MPDNCPPAVANLLRAQFFTVAGRRGPEFDPVVVAAGFLEGVAVFPAFVRPELAGPADSTAPLPMGPLGEGSR
jgi:hypothetical protein